MGIAEHLPQIDQRLAARHCYRIRRGFQQCSCVPLRLAALVADGIFHRCTASLERIAQKLASAITAKNDHAPSGNILQFRQCQQSFAVETFGRRDNIGDTQLVQHFRTALSDRGNTQGRR